MKLTLGQAAKEAGVSKPSLSVAIKKGRLSAHKNQSGIYEIDPAELFRVYPKNRQTDGLANGNSLPETNPKKPVSLTGKEDTLSLLLAERDKLLAEKDKAIERLEREKSDIREDLQDQKEQAKRITQLLEHHSSGVGDFQQTVNSLQQQIGKQEAMTVSEQEKAQAIQAENDDLHKALMVFRYASAGVIALALIGAGLFGQFIMPISM